MPVAAEHNFKLSASQSMIFHWNHNSERSINTNMEKTAHTVQNVDSI